MRNDRHLRRLRDDDPEAIVTYSRVPGEPAAEDRVEPFIDAAEVPYDEPARPAGRGPVRAAAERGPTLRAERYDDGFYDDDPADAPAADFDAPPKKRRRGYLGLVLTAAGVAIVAGAGILYVSLSELARVDDRPLSAAATDGSDDPAQAEPGIRAVRFDDAAPIEPAAVDGDGDVILDLTPAGDAGKANADPAAAKANAAAPAAPVPPPQPRVRPERVATVPDGAAAGDGAAAAKAPAANAAAPAPDAAATDILGDPDFIGRIEKTLANIGEAANPAPGADGATDAAEAATFNGAPPLPNADPSVNGFPAPGANTTGAPAGGARGPLGGARKPLDAAPPPLPLPAGAPGFGAVPGGFDNAPAFDNSPAFGDVAGEPVVIDPNANLNLAPGAFDLPPEPDAAFIPPADIPNPGFGGAAGVQ